MLEEEARKKWCPMVRSVSEQWGSKESLPANNRIEGSFNISQLCIASDCMMWRYVDYEYVIPEGVPPNSRGNLEGYCGLAK